MHLQTLWLLCVYVVLGSTVEVELVFEYSLVHFYSLSEQAEIFIEQLIAAMSNVTGVNEWASYTPR